jgi:hypothetical protein
MFHSIPTVKSVVAPWMASPLFVRDSGIDSPRQIIGWWEARRGPYNLIVAIAGVVTTATGVLSVSVANAFLESPIQRPDPPLFFFAALYAVAANLGYTGGWMVELIAGRLLGVRSGHLAVLSFRLGLVFSILVTLLPAVFAMGFALHAFLTRRPLIVP